MINKEMKQEFNKQKTNSYSNAKPNETSGIYFSSGVKIFDPNTKEILVQKRGDDWCLLLTCRLRLRAG